MVKMKSYIAQNKKPGAKCLVVYYDRRLDNLEQAIRKGLSDHSLKAEQFADGHLTIMRFTTHWKAMLGTPDMDTKEGRGQVRDLRGHESLEEALEYLAEGKVYV